MSSLAVADTRQRPGASRVETFETVWRIVDEKFYDPRKAWPQYCSNIVKMRALPCGHYPAEQVPDDVYSELRDFFKE